MESQYAVSYTHLDVYKRQDKEGVKKIYIKQDVGATKLNVAVSRLLYLITCNDINIPSVVRNFVIAHQHTTRFPQVQKESELSRNVAIGPQ